jgi:hypothetical protein
MLKNIKPTILEESIVYLKETFNIIDPKTKDTKTAIINFMDQFTKDGSWLPQVDFKLMEQQFAKQFMAGSKKNMQRYGLYKPTAFDKAFAGYDGAEDQKEIMMAVMVYDAFTGTHDPKLFEVEFDLWDKLMYTDIKNILISDVKMPFDTMVVRFSPQHCISKLKIVKDIYLNTTEDKNLPTWFDSMVVTTDGEDYQFYFPVVIPELYPETRKNIMLIGLKGHNLQKINTIVQTVEDQSITDPNQFDFESKANQCIVAFINLLLYINSVNKNVTPTKAIKVPKLLNRQIMFSGMESFYVHSNVKLDGHFHSNNLNGIGTPKTCTKWDVRGHWRKQPCGINKTATKLIWIEPFSKGIFRSDNQIKSSQTNYTV